jgi:2,4-dienoyl-CoA reductase (NADPH2)
MANDLLFQPLEFRNLTVKNRIFRSNVAGRFDNYDGSGTQTRINWELKFARGGVGAIISSFVAVHIRGRILPNYATIDRDERIPFWRELGKRVHEEDCKFILQLSHSGRQRDIGGIEFPGALSSTSRPEPLHGFECEAMTVEQIEETVQAFAAGARRAREAGLDGVELHAANGYLFTQFLSSAINDRQDQYGGALESRARFLLEVIRAIRQEVGDDFHLQVKISAVEHNNALLASEAAGNTLQDSLQVCQWAEQAGADAIHVSTGSSFPHPRNPAGDFPIEEIVKTYDSMISSGTNTLRNYLLFRSSPSNQIFQSLWNKARGEQIEGVNLPESRAIKQAVGVPVLCTGGFQTASIIGRAIQDGSCDAVTIARPLIANNDLVKLFAQGLDSAPRPCTYCNKCLVNVIENPLGCYEESRFSSREEMIQQILSVFDPPPFS